MSVESFIEIFSGLERAHGVTYVDKKGADGQKIKGKSFVTRETCYNKYVAAAFARQRTKSWYHSNQR